MPTNKKKLFYIASTASHLRRFHEPYITALRTTCTVVTIANGEGVDQNIRFAKSFFSIRNFKCVGQLRRLVRRERPDAILVHTSLAAFLTRLSMLGMRNRPYVLNVVHGYLFQKEGHGLKHRFLLLCEQLMRHYTDDIAVMNDDDYEIARRYRLCRGEVYMTRGMGIPDAVQTAGADRAEIRESLGISADSFVCTFVGELSGRKNQAFLIRCTARLRRSGLPVKLLLLGEGDKHAELSALAEELGIADAVIFAGNREPILPYLSATELYVSASHSEGLPFNIMEAMASGLPILASATKGQTDLLRDIPDALYPAGDEEAFCRLAEQQLHAGCLGAGSCTYPNLLAYRLSEVFSDNMKFFTKRWRDDAEN